MKKSTKIVTSEYVSYGHPDKVADQISDALLDAYLDGDKNTRAGIETMIKDNIVVVGGEVKSNADVDVESIVRITMDSIGYPKSHKLGGKDVKIVNLIGEQSQEISSGVDREDCDCIGAGDQGFVVGMASNETCEYLPLGHYIARKICKSVCRVENLGPDVKTQICVEYGARVPKVKSIIVSTMHSENISVEVVREVIEEMIKTNSCAGLPIMDDNTFIEFIKNKDIEYYINVNGEWHIGGPISDCGLTGRKIVVDQYGGYCNVGGGAFSGKDMTKVDRSAAYMCRYLAKNIVDTGLVGGAKVELSYIISEPQPCAINVELNDIKEGAINDLKEQIEKFIREKVDLTPKGIIERFFPCGVKPIFYNTARNGHFGFNFDEWYPWEYTDLSNKIKEFIDNVVASRKEN